MRMERTAQLMQCGRAQLWINPDNAQNATIPHAPRFIE